MRRALLLGCLLLLSCTGNVLIEDFEEPRCEAVSRCGELVLIDCGAEVDGPAYYVNATSGEEISACGGACRTADPGQLEVCRNLCPPPSWDC